MASAPEAVHSTSRSGAEATSKHLARVYRIVFEISEMPEGKGEGDDELLRTMHKTIDEVTKGVESFGFNAAIAKLYAFTNTLQKSNAGGTAKKAAATALAHLMSPMTPHLSEEMWTILGGQGLVTTAKWPVADPAMLIDDTVTLPIQVNGKRRGEIVVPKDLPKEEVEKLVLADQAVVRALDGAAPKKIIVVPGRIVNLVI